MYHNPREVTLFGFPSLYSKKWKLTGVKQVPHFNCDRGWPATETGQDQDEWMSALAHHVATDVYESTDDYDQIQCVRDANQHDWIQDCQTLAMTQRDMNYLSKWVDYVKAAHTIRNNDGDCEGTPTQLNF